MSQIERDVRVDTVDSVDRTGEGWRVTGSLYNGERFTCRIGQDGRVDDIDYGGLAANAPAEDKQWGDDRYAAAWNDVDSGKIARPEATAPAYPGGPIDGDVAEGDDRYETAEAPDFNG